MGDGVLEMRLVVTADDYAAALAFYRDMLGLTQLAAFDDGAGHVVILDAGRATLELCGRPPRGAHRRGGGGPARRGPHPGGVRGARCGGRDDAADRRRRHAHRAADADTVALAELAARRARAGSS